MAYKLVIFDRRNCVVRIETPPENMELSDFVFELGFNMANCTWLAGDIKIEDNT